MSRGIRWFLVLASVISLAACQKEKGSGSASAEKPGISTSKDFTQVIAKVGDTEITQGDFDRRYSQLSEGDRKAFEGDDWRKRFLDQIIEETVLYKKAIDEHYDQDPKIQAQLDLLRRQVLIKAYTNQISANSVPDDETIQAYYDANKEQFRTLDRVVVSHISCKDEQKIDKAYAELTTGTNWDIVAAKYNEDPNSLSNHGLIGWINPTGFVLGVGLQPEFNKIAFSLERQKFSKPVLINRRWEIIRAGNKVKGEIPSIDQVKPRVIEKLRSVVLRKNYKKTVRDLEQEYSVERFGKYKTVAANSAEELYRRAAEVHDPQTRIDFYNQIANNYPNSDLADKALFTAGFIYSEQLKRVNFAFEEFHQLLSKYPNSEYADDAKWMIKNLGKANLENSESSSAEEIQQQINSRQGK